MTKPRQHHIVPAWYLAGFTAEGTRTSKIRVFDQLKGIEYGATPKTAVRERDYFRYESSGGDAFFMEELLAWHEGVIGPVVRSVVRNRRAAHKREVGECLSLAAALIVRSRVAREQVSDLLRKNIVYALRRGTVTRDEWDHFRADEFEERC